MVIDTLGAVANGGAQALTWLLVVSLTFFVPAGLVISELGAAFPQEGGSYIWTRLAFGRLCGALTAFLYWIESPIWLGGSLTITALTVFGEFFVPLEGIWRYLFALGFIWTAIAVAIAPLAKGKRVPVSGAAAQVILLTFFTATVGLYALEHGAHGFGLGHFSPTWAAFIAVAPVLFYNLIGFELPSAAAGEMRNPQRDVPASIARAGVLTVVLYTVPILAILAVVPADRITSLTGFIDAMKSVFTVYGGHVTPDGAVVLAGAGQVLGGLAAAGFIWILLANGLTWVMGTGRSQAVACLDGAGPRSLGALLGPFGHPRAHVSRLGCGRDRDDGRRLRRFRKQRRAVLQRCPVALDRPPGPFEPGRVSGSGQAPPLAPGCRAALPGARRGSGRLAVQRPRYRLGGLRHPGRALAGAGNP